MYRFITTKFSYKIKHSFFTSLKLLSSDNIREIQFEMFYSPPHEQVVWNYQDAINDLIQKKSTYPNSNVKEIFLTRLSISKYQFLMKLFQLSGQVLFSRKPNFLGNDSRKKQYFSALHDKLK